MAVNTLGERRLEDLSGIGQAMLGDFRVLKIRTVAELSTREGDDLYAELCERTGVRHDICVLDTLRCAVAQARDPRLPKERRNWWWWSRQRKAGRLG